MKEEFKLFDRPLISICIAIYNRLAPFQFTFERLLRQVEESGSDLVEIVVSINPPEDGNTEVIEYAKQKCQQKPIKLLINEINIGGEANILNAVNNASGKYIWIIGDDDLLLPGTVSKVINILKAHDNTKWIFLNTARVRGNIECVNKDLITPKIANLCEGYYENGIETVLKIHKQIDAALLFSTSNIFLRESMQRIQQQQMDKNDCNQLASIIESASQGGAYIIDEPCILAGGVTTWSNRQDYFLGVHYNRDILCAVGNGLSRKKAVSLISYRMRHGAIRSWFVIYRMILRGNPLGLTAIKELYKVIPVETTFNLMFAPFIALYLLFRHKIRNYKRLKECKVYKNSICANPEIIERIL